LCVTEAFLHKRVSGLGLHRHDNRRRWISTGRVARQPREQQPLRARMQRCPIRGVHLAEWSHTPGNGGLSAIVVYEANGAFLLSRKLTNFANLRL
jgi:hypothetical protein